MEVVANRYVLHLVDLEPVSFVPLYIGGIQFTDAAVSKDFDQRRETNLDSGGSILLTAIFDVSAPCNEFSGCSGEVLIPLKGEAILDFFELILLVSLCGFSILLRS